MHMDQITPPALRERPYGNAFAWGGIWLVGLTASFTLFYGHFAAEGFGRFLGMTLLSSALCGYLGHRSKTPWSFWKTGGMYLPLALAIFLVSSFGAMTRH